MFGPWKYTHKKNFTPLNLTVQEIFRKQGAKQGSYAYKLFSSILLATELGLLSFERELFSTSDEGKGFFNFNFLKCSDPQNLKNLKIAGKVF
jgi:hypothetical protein